MFTMSRKSNLAHNLKIMKKTFPHEYNFFPRTWLLPSESGNFIEYYRVILFLLYFITKSHIKIKILLTSSNLKQVVKVKEYS